MNTKPAGDYSIGSEKWPGLSKLIEECGEVVQVAGKLIATNGEAGHWDGSDLYVRLQEELADLAAAVAFVARMNLHNPRKYKARVTEKLRTFHAWHDQQKGVPK